MAEPPAQIQHVRRRRPGACTLLEVELSGGSCCGGSHLWMLSPREREAFFHVVSGLTIREISGEMGIQQKTVENYRQRILEKLGARCAVEVVHYAVQHGFLRRQDRGDECDEKKSPLLRRRMLPRTAAVVLAESTL